jgi:hypothetical protein
MDVMTGSHSIVAHAATGKEMYAAWLVRCSSRRYQIMTEMTRRHFMEAAGLVAGVPLRWRQQALPHRRRRARPRREKPAVQGI